MFRRFVIIVAVAITPSVAGAASATCAAQVLRGSAPVLVNPKLTPRTQEICYSGYVTLHSGITRTPLWSAEHLTRNRVESAHGIERYNDFHPDPNLPPDDRAELSDYARSGFDRGHMAPSGDMPDPRSQQESFSLANMIPQNPNNNRHLWAGIESAVRDLARDEGDLYVVSGPSFQGETLQRLHGRVLVPTVIWKAVYDPRRQQAGAYVVTNAPGDEWQNVSVADVQRLTGIDVFPDLPNSVKATPMDLPKPMPHAPRGHGRRERGEPGF